MQKSIRTVFKSSQFSPEKVSAHSNKKLVNKFVKRFGILGIGAFILVAFSTQSAGSHTEKSAKTKQASIDLVQNTPSSTSGSQTATNNESQDNMTNSNSSQGSSVSTNVTSNTSNGSSTTSVTVNGKQIAVPANGYVETNVNNSQVNLSHSSTDQGSSVNLNVSSDDSQDGGN
jgi:hypothetical protein